MTPSSPPSNNKSCCRCKKGNCKECVCAKNNKDCISCISKSCTRTSKSKNIEPSCFPITQTASSSPAELNIEKAISSHRETHPFQASVTNPTVPFCPSPDSHRSIPGSMTPTLPSEAESPTHTSSTHIPLALAEKFSNTKARKTAFIGDNLMSKVQTSDLSGKSTLYKINKNDYSALFHIIESENSFKNYLIVLTDHVEYKEVSKMSTAILAKNPIAKIYLAEPVNLATIEQRHRFMALCYSLKLRVIPTGKLRDDSTGTPDERLFHQEDASLNKNGIITFFNTVARYVPHWVEALPSHYYNNVSDKQSPIMCPPFFCFPPSYRHPLVSSPYHLPLTFSYSSVPPHHHYHSNSILPAPLHHSHSNSRHSAPSFYPQTDTLRFPSVPPHLPNTNDSHSSRFPSEPPYNLNTNNSQSVPPNCSHTNSSHSAPNYHTHTNSFKSVHPLHPYSNSSITAPSHHPLTHSIPPVPPPHPHSPTICFHSAPPHHLQNKNIQSVPPTLHPYTNSSQSAPPHVQTHPYTLHYNTKHPANKSHAIPPPHAHENPSLTHHSRFNGDDNIRQYPPNHLEPALESNTDHHHPTQPLSSPSTRRTYASITAHPPTALGTLHENANGPATTRDTGNPRNSNNASKTLSMTGHAWGERINSHYHALSQAYAQEATVKNKFQVQPTQTSMNIDTTNSLKHDHKKISTVLGNLKLTKKETPKDGHCLLHSIIESWKGQIDDRSDLEIGSLINEADSELSQNMHHYIAFLALNKGTDDIIMTYKENYFTHKLYNHDLGDLMPTVLSNALGLVINIIEELNFGNVRKITIKPEQRMTRKKAGNAIFIHLKDSHYSALVPLKCFSKSHRLNGGPNHSKISTNKFSALYDAPGTCIYTEDESDRGPRSQNISPSSRMDAYKCATNGNNIHEYSSKPM